MEKYFIPEQMKSLAGQTVKCYGYDQQNTINYSFNSLGFRSPEPAPGRRLVVIGNSMSFGIGVEIQYTFGYLLALATDRHLDNRSLGCVQHENHDYLDIIKSAIKQQQDSIFVIQINNLDRCREKTEVYNNNDPTWCVKKFLDFFNQAEELLSNIKHTYIYWDNIKYDLPDAVMEKIIINNKLHLDSSIPNMPETFGIKSHNAIAKIMHHFI